MCVCVCVCVLMCLCVLVCVIVCMCVSVRYVPRRNKCAETARKTNGCHMRVCGIATVANRFHGTSLEIWHICFEVVYVYFHFFFLQSIMWLVGQGCLPLNISSQLQGKAARSDPPPSQRVGSLVLLKANTYSIPDLSACLCVSSSPPAGLPVSLVK